jgi:hypothetical protein
MAAMGGAIEEIDVVRGAPTELIPNIAANVLQNLRKKSGAQFTESEVEMEIVRQLRPYTGNMVSEREIKEVRQAMFPTKNMMYGGAIEDLTGGMARGLREGGAANPKIEEGGLREQTGALTIPSEIANFLRPRSGRLVTQDEIDTAMRQPLNPGVSTEEAAMQFIIRAEQDPRLKNTPEYEVARSVLQMLKQRSGSMFTNQEMEQEIVRQLRPRSGNLIQQSEIDDVKKGIASMPAMMYGGPVMAYAQGGAVQMQEGGGMDPSQFPRMDGDINGPGTETSDDIPAMLSDGEFVMTGQAVRGAGTYDMAMDPKGIISLVPSFEEDRERGMDLMYKMMDAFSTNAESS